MTYPHPCTHSSWPTVMFYTPSMAHCSAFSLSEATLERLFAEFDRDNSGSIQVAEFAAIADRLGLVLPADEIQALITEYDADGSGSIDLEEFREVWS